jgi:hypothetical protein
VSEWKTGAGERGGHLEVDAHEKAHKANDWRVYQIIKLGLEAEEAKLDQTHAAWVASYTELEEARLWVWGVKRKLEDLEKALTAEMDETAVQAACEGVRSAQAERAKKRQAMMEQDPKWKALISELDSAESVRRKAELKCTVDEENRKHFRSRMSWRTSLVDFWRTVQRVPIAYAPDADNVPPAQAQHSPTPSQGRAGEGSGTEWQTGSGSVHDVPQRYDGDVTQRWVNQMAAPLLRYGASGKLALEVLPAGVDPNNPKVLELLADIRQHFAEEKQERTL